MTMLRVRYLLAFKPKSVWTIGPEEPVLAAIQVMADKHIGALPVVRDE
jgi:CBS domain-containing protein